MPIAVTVWKCEHCLKRRLASKSKIKKHEKECWYNPELKACTTCNHDEFGHCHKLDIKRDPHDPPRVECPYWDNKIDEDIKDYPND